MRKMKALIIDDRSVSGTGGMVYHAVLEARGHAVRSIDAPLVHDAEFRVHYTAEMFDHILADAREFSPDWVIMVLQGRDSSDQIAAARAIYKETSTTKFYFISGYPHKEELDHVRSQGLNLRFEEMPIHPVKLVADLEQSF